MASVVKTAWFRDGEGEPDVRVNGVVAGDATDRGVAGQAARATAGVAAAGRGSRILARWGIAEGCFVDGGGVGIRAEPVLRGVGW